MADIKAQYFVTAPGEFAAATCHGPHTVYEIIDRYMIRTSRMARHAFPRRLESEAGE